MLLQDLVLVLVDLLAGVSCVMFPRSKGIGNLANLYRQPNTTCMCAAMVLGRHQVSVDPPKAGFEQGVGVREEAWPAASALLAVSAAAGCEKPCVGRLGPMWHHHLVGRHDSSVPYS